LDLAPESAEEIRRTARFGAMDGILTGVLLILAYVTLAYLPFGTSDHVLAVFPSVATIALAGQVVIALFSVFAILFALALRSLLRDRDRRMSMAATLFFGLGSVLASLLAILMVSETSTLASLYAAGGPNRPAIALQEDVVQFGLSGALNLSEFLLSVGIFAFGALMVRSRTFPNWVGYLGMVGAGVFLIGIAISSFLVLIAGFVPTLAWVFAASAFIWRSARTPGAASPTTSS
jgi:uncharacterized protein DUF4386